MDLAISAPLVLAAVHQRCRCIAVEGARMSLPDLLRDLLHADAADTRRSHREVLLDEVAVKADGLEDLGAAVALQRGDAHLRHHLQHALVERLDVLGNGLAVRHVGERSLSNQVVQRFERQVRIDRAGAVAKQQRHVVHFARVAAFDQQAALGARAFAHQVVMHAGSGQQAGNGRVLRIHTTVRKNQDAVARCHGGAGLAAQLRHRAFQTRTIFIWVVQQRQRRRSEARARRQVAQLGNLIVVQHGEVDLDLAAVLGHGLEQVAFRADAGAHRRDQLFADRIERRIGDLGEQLLEVVVQQARLVREHGERGVGAHRAHRLLAVLRHGRHQHAQVFLRVAEGLLAAKHRLMVGSLGRSRGEILDIDRVLLQPLAVGLLGRQRPLDLVVADDAALAGIDQQHFAGTQAILADDVVGGDVEDADFRRHDHEVVLGDAVARRPQAVAIEHRADQRTVGEGDRGGTVPRLHQRRVVLVERAHRRVHGGVARPRLGDHHQHRMRQRAPGHDQELQHVVERGGVAATRRDDRQHFLQIVAKDARLQQAFARLHPVGVAAQRVDFAVVRDIAIGMRERPRRKRVGREALVHERERRLELRIRQIREHALNLRGRQHALVDDGVRRQAGDVEVLALVRRQVQRRHFVLNALAGDVELAFKDGAGGPRAGVCRTDEQLLEHRRDRGRALANLRDVGRHRAPAEHGEAFFHGNAVHQRAQLRLDLMVAGQEHQARAVGTRRRQQEVHGLAQKLVRHLDEDAGAVPGIRVGT